MAEKVFAEVDAAIKRMGTTEFRTAADYFGILVIPVTSSILGYASHYRSVPAIGVNERLEGQDEQFAGWHEIGHVLAGHIWEPKLTACGLMDTAFFTEEADSRSIAQHEKVANLVAAHAVVDTENTLEAIGYNSRTLKQYRRLKDRQDELTREYESLLFSVNTGNATAKVKAGLKGYKRALGILEEEKQGLEGDLIDMNLCRPLPAIATELGVSERVFRYKLEALRLQGYDIDPQELECYDRMFENAAN